MNQSRSLPEVREAAMRSILRGGKWFWLLVAAMGMTVLMSLCIWIYQLIEGLSITNLTDQIFWGVYTANLITFIGFSYGGALISAILRLVGAQWRAPITRIAEASALVTLAIGTSFIFIHLGRPERVWQFFVTPNGSSPLIWDALAISTYLIATLIFLYLPLIPDLAVAADWPGIRPWRRRLYRFLSLGWRGTPKQHKVLERAMNTMAIIIIPIAVTVHSVLSWAFSVTTREGWHSTVFGPYFVVAALYSGVALVTLAVLVCRKAYGLQKYIQEQHIRYMSYIMLTLGVAYVYFTFSELLTSGYSMADKVVELFEVTLVYPYGPFFWIFFFAGGVVPTLLVALPKTRNFWGIGVASFLVVASMGLKRYLIVVPAQATPLITGDYAFYWPSIFEILLTLGGIVAMPLLLMLFFRFFPVLSFTEIEELSETAPPLRTGATSQGQPHPIPGGSGTPTP